MTCRVCMGSMKPRITDLPFKLGNTSIVILKSVPALECAQCGEIELEHPTMMRVDEILSAVDQSTELEVIRYAA